MPSDTCFEVVLPRDPAHGRQPPSPGMLPRRVHASEGGGLVMTDAGRRMPDHPALWIQTLERLLRPVAADAHLANRARTVACSTAEAGRDDRVHAPETAAIPR